MSEEREIIDRKMAIAMGLKRYFTGEPCPSGHISERRVSDRACIGCCIERLRRLAIENPEKVKEYRRRYRAKSREKIRESFRRYYVENRERRIGYSRRYRAENLEKCRESQRRYQDAARAALLALKQLGITIKGDSNATR